MSAAAPPAAENAGDVSRGPGLWLGQLAAVFGFSLRIAFRSKRLWILAVVAFLPVLLPALYLVFRLLDPSISDYPPAMSVFRTMVSVAYLRVILYILGLAYGLALLSEEVEGKTVIHLLLRPIPRWIPVAGKFLAAWLVSACLLAGSLAVVYASLWAVQKTGADRAEGLRWENLRILLLDGVILIGALAPYLALFGCLGARLPHGERWGIAFCFGWESLITYLPARLKWMTVMYHVQTLFPHNVNVIRTFGLAGEPLSKPVCVLILLGVTVAGLALTVDNLRRRELS